MDTRQRCKIGCLFCRSRYNKMCDWVYLGSLISRFSHLVPLGVRTNVHLSLVTHIGEQEKNYENTLKTFNLVYHSWQKI
jgi:hypothetical protein